MNFQEVETDQFYNFFLPELKKDGYDGVFSPKSRAKTMSENDRKRVDGCAIFFRAIKLVSLLFTAVYTIYIYYMFYVLVVVMTCVEALGYTAPFIIISGFWHTCIRFNNLYQLNTCLLYIHIISFGFPILETNPRPLLIGMQSRWQSHLNGLFRVINLFSPNYTCYDLISYFAIHLCFVWTELWLNPHRPLLYMLLIVIIFYRVIHLTVNNKQSLSQMYKRIN